MANGIKSLRQIQLCRETSQGTSTTDYEVWRGEGTIKDMRETVFPEEDIGIFGGTTRNYTPKLGCELTISETPATFEQLYHIFDSGLYSATATTDASSAKIRTYTLPLTQSTLKSSTDLQTFSTLAGDNNEVEAASFLFTREFELSGSAGGALNVSAVMEGREVAPDTDGFDASAEIVTVEEILFSKGRLYIDPASATDFGLTEVSNTLLECTLSVNELWRAKHAASGRLDFSFIKMTKPEIMLDITFEHNTSAATEKAAWRDHTTRLIQLKFEGTALSDTDATATYDTKTLICNLPGRWETFEALDEQDGNNTVTGTFRVRYDATAAKFAQFILVNERE